MQYKGDIAVIRPAVWARVLVFIRNLLELMRRDVGMFETACRKYYCFSHLQSAAFSQGNVPYVSPTNIAAT
jgi:hypothetical protein